ncbi:MAG TPA: hypothetical protein VGD65_18550 [Chryseosolibacter sp.]
MTSFYSLLLQYRSPKGAPYDSTQGVPDYVFIIFWVILLAFGIRVAWEFRDSLLSKAIKTRDKIFPKATAPPARPEKTK